MPLGRLATGRHRVRQGVAAILVRPAGTTASLAAATLGTGELVLFRRMSAHDQAHAVRVATCLLADGHTEHDLIAAALLHDLAKAGTRDRPGRVRLPDRVLRVVLGRVAPSTLRWLAADPDRPGCRGLNLAVHHARLGAVAAAMASSSERTCWLIAHHEMLAPRDPDLQRLVAADAVSP